jgi:hypothetical protein
MKPFEIKGGFLSFFFIKVYVSPKKGTPRESWSARSRVDRRQRKQVLIDRRNLNFSNINIERL